LIRLVYSLILLWGFGLWYSGINLFFFGFSLLKYQNSIFKKENIFNFVIVKERVLSVNPLPISLLVI